MCLLFGAMNVLRAKLAEQLAPLARSSEKGTG